MSRRARVIAPHVAHHVTQRGNYQQKVFEQQEDFRRYLYWISLYAQRYEVKIHAYCLMTNHVHFIVTPTNQTSLARLFNTVHMLYAQYKNVKKGKAGHFWQGRFYSCILSDSHLVRAVRYVEMNPVRSKLVRWPWDYLWSSARQHLQMEHSPIVRTAFHAFCLSSGLNSRTWKAYLLEEDDDMVLDIRKKTQKGLAIGTSEYINALELKLGVDLKTHDRGRPKGKNRDSANFWIA